MPTTVTRKAQVTLPKAVRDQVGIQPGDRVTVSAGSAGEIILRRTGTTQQTAEASWLDRALDEIRARRGDRPAPFSTDEIMRMTRGED